jgi:nitrate/nitrite-specific signal transduction histidine kinase
LSENELKAKDETATLARSFNDMAGKLDDLYRNLDAKVKEKTKKLVLSENTLKKNLSEAEKMNKLMVGRELEMIKLKQELVQLKNKVKN